MTTRMCFRAQQIPGSRRGRSLGVPTINLDLHDVPADLPEGIYAAWVRLGEEGPRLPGVMHYGPRPVFKDSKSCEVHLLERKLEARSSKLETLTVEVVRKIRKVQDFPDVEALKQEMARDIAKTKEILKSTSRHGSADRRVPVPRGSTIGTGSP